MYSGEIYPKIMALFCTHLMEKKSFEVTSSACKNRLAKIASSSTSNLTLLLERNGWGWTFMTLAMAYNTTKVNGDKLLGTNYLQKKEFCMLYLCN